MLEKLLNRILELRDKPPLTLEIDGRTYSTSNINPVMEPTASSIPTQTLTGLVDFLGHETTEGVLIHIVSPALVRLRGPVFGDFQQRACFLHAESNGPTFRFGSPIPIEDLIIQLQAMFVPTESSIAMVKLLSNLKTEESVQLADDGVSQQVTAKTGITKVEPVNVPNPVVLQPYRTFMEVAQPPSQCIFRLSGQGDSLLGTIHVADGGGWELEAMGNIKTWLNDHLSGTPPVIIA